MILNEKKDKWSNVFEKITSIYIVLMLTIYLLYVGHEGYQNITKVKFNMFCIISCIYLLLIILLYVELLFIGQKKLSSLWSSLKTTSWTQKLVLVFFLFSLLSAIFSDNHSVAFKGGSRFEGLLTIAIYCICFFATSIYGKPAKWQIYILGLSMTIFCCISIIQLMGYNPFSLYPKGYNYFDGNVKYAGFYISTVGNIDLASALLCLTTPIFLIGVIRMSEKRKFFLLVPLILCIIVTFAIKVQAGILGEVVGLILVMPVVLPVKTKIKKLLCVVILLFIILGIFLLWNYDFEGNETLFEAHELLHGNWEDEYGTGRIYIWKNVINLIPEKLFLGGGPDTLLDRMATHFQRYDEKLDLTIYALVDVAHNEYLNIIVNQGLFALIFYLLALASSAIRWVKNSTNIDAAICGSAVLCYCIQAFFGISMCITSIFFWLTLGLLEKSINVTRKEYKNEKRSKKASIY
ncbi:O-antigen ligase family protein [Sedimentibacter sp. zth1]|uniref:O-antigen ligase family protein n=1 Tax=Sedimentibacter sp. zth1 TaxID=2816908 RepID=UPI001A91EAFB|nr:O-antigen ligase family protein [Sedimentibacter sp. zth1]QSX06103.1 O-antigen ligase family protein [Sedimentibacter sp. zth1]